MLKKILTAMILCAFVVVGAGNARATTTKGDAYSVIFCDGERYNGLQSHEDDFSKKLFWNGYLTCPLKSEVRQGFRLPKNISYANVIVWQLAGLASDERVRVRICAREISAIWENPICTNWKWTSSLNGGWYVLYFYQSDLSLLRGLYSYVDYTMMVQATFGKSGRIQGEKNATLDYAFVEWEY